MQIVSKPRQIAYLLTALLISVFVIRVFFLDSFMVAGNSMAPTLQNGDYIFVNKLAYLKSEPQRYDIVVGNFREISDKKVIKRVVGLPKEWVFIENGLVFVSSERNGARQEVGKLDSEAYTGSFAVQPYSYHLDPHEYFLIGDNGLSSVDSRELGPVDVYKIDGKVLVKFRFK